MGRNETEEGTLDLHHERFHDGEDVVLQVSAGGPFETYAIDETITIGRSRKNDVTIANQAVSGRHAIIRTRPRLQLKDLGSRNGTRVRGEPIEPNVFVDIGLGELMEIGGAFAVVRAAGASARARRIWSHDYFEARVEEECERAAREPIEFTIARLRVPGDADIPLIDNAVASVFRAVDVVARYADREYEILLAGTPPLRAEMVVNRAARRISRTLRCSDEVETAIAAYPRDGTHSEQLLSHLSALLRNDRSNEHFIGGRHIDHVRMQIAQVADSDLSVLLLGETGVGKEVCARQIHASSPRKDKRMLSLNCSAFPENMLEAELFGYEQGAFTGAARAKPGLLEATEGGTVFLDEIGDIPLPVQVKLLRVIESRQVQRIGALEPVDIDVRFISATHRDLEGLIAAGRFRQDLYFRINGFTIRIPSLRNRHDELEPLARSFAREAMARSGHSGEPEFTPEVMSEFHAYAWPGNIRELRNVVERAVVLSRGGRIELEHIPAEKMRSTLVPMPPKRVAAPPTDDGEDEEFNPQVTQDVPVPRNLRSALQEQERDAILAALDECAGNQTRAAKLLGISRGTLVSRLDKYGIPRPRKKKR